MPGAGDGSSGRQMYTPALRIYGIANESSNFKESTASDVPGSLWQLLSGHLTARPTGC